MQYTSKPLVYLWIVWHRGKQPTEVCGIAGLYARREDALNQASFANIEGMTPIVSRLHANLFRAALPHLLEKNLLETNAEDA